VVEKASKEVGEIDVVVVNAGTYIHEHLLGGEACAEA
jgi:NADP-dependent 3-hydroxy acid dehydrogenase YdfG